MDDTKLYIFGTPHNNFDLYQGNENEINYFQTFNNGSNENEKFTILRPTNGQVSYSYLRYNLISNSNVLGAFFGMSVVFNNGIYCTDVKSLYDLFKVVYSNILQKNVLLKLENDKTVFQVSKYEDAKDEIMRITSILEKNIRNNFVGDFKKLDPDFKQGINLNKEKQMNYKATNNAILLAMKEYPVVSVSPAYKAKVIIKNLPKETVERIQKVESTVSVIQSKDKWVIFWGVVAGFATIVLIMLFIGLWLK